MKIPYIPLILGLLIAGLIFYAGCNCGKNSVAAILVKHDTIPDIRYIDGVEHASIESTLGETQNQVFTPAEQKLNKKIAGGGTVDRQHDLSVHYRIDSSHSLKNDTLSARHPISVDTSKWLQVDTPDWTIDSSDVKPFSDSLRAHGFRGHLEWNKRWGLVAVYDTITGFTDRISIRDYWKGNQLFVDATSQYGTITSMGARAVYKEPRFFWGPSITVSYNGKLLVIPGISIVYALRLGRKH